MPWLTRTHLLGHLTRAQVDVTVSRNLLKQAAANDSPDQALHHAALTRHQATLDSLTSQLVASFK